MLKFMLAMSFALLSNINCMEDDASATVEMYSDEMPYLKKITSQSVFSLLEKKSSYLIDKIFTYEENMKNFVFSPIEGCNEEKFFFVSQQTSKIESIEIKKCKVMVNKLVFSPNKWECPRPILSHRMESSVNMLSWQYVHFYLHTFPQLETTRTHHIDNDKMELFSLIRKVGLTKSFVRIFVHQHDHTSDTYIAYNSLEEMKDLENMELFNKLHKI